jgi:HprK-related kinase A
MTTLQTLARPDLAERLRGAGVALQCGPLVMRLGTSLSELIDPIALLYADFPIINDDQLPDFHARVEPLPRWRRPFRATASAVVDGRAVFDPFHRHQALAMFEWVMNWCLFSRPNQYLLLHAAVVEIGGSALILSGEPGAGKSTLAASLAFRGWRLFSDEVGMVRPGTRALLPLPRPVGLKNESIEIVRRDAPSAVIGPSIVETRKGTVAHMRPPAGSVARAGETAEPRWIVFPRFTAGALPEARPLSRADALLRLGGESFNYSVLGATGFHTLADVVDGCTCFEVRYGSLEDALAAIEYVTGAPVERSLP